jgi:hypothetical protein
MFGTLIFVRLICRYALGPMRPTFTVLALAKV